MKIRRYIGVLVNFLFLFCLTGSALATNEHVLIHYHAWFEGPSSPQWKGDGPPLNPSTTNVGTGGANSCPTTAEHSHSSYTNDIKMSFYPSRGLYNNTTAADGSLAAHRSNIISSGAKGVIISYGPTTPLGIVQAVAAELTQNGGGTLNVAFAIRAYPGRNEDSVRDNIANLLSTVPTNQLYRVKFDNWIALSSATQRVFRPMFYLFASNSQDNGPLCLGLPVEGTWACLFRPNGVKTNRNTVPYIILADGRSFLSEMDDNGYDGGYSYNPAKDDDVVFYSQRISRAWTGGFIYSAGVGPGYNPARARPNDKCNARFPGQYKNEIIAARKSQDIDLDDQAPHFINVVTFNEWAEGTQIEPAQTAADGMSTTTITAPGVAAENGKKYLGYASDGTPDTPVTGPNLYINLTNSKLDPTRYKPINPTPILPGGCTTPVTCIPVVEP